MHPIVIPDLATFQQFQNGQQVTISQLMTQSYLDEITENNMLVEVWYHSNTPTNQHHTGIVLSINGPILTIPEGTPEAISMTIQRV